MSVPTAAPPPQHVSQPIDDMECDEDELARSHPMDVDKFSGEEDNAGMDNSGALGEEDFEEKKENTAADVLSRIAEAQRQGVTVSSIYCPPPRESAADSPAAEPAKKAKRTPKPVEIGEDGQPIKRKRGRPRIHPLPAPVLGPDGLPIKRKRGRPRKNPLPEESPGANVTPAKRPRGRPRKTPIAEGNASIKVSVMAGGDKEQPAPQLGVSETDSPSKLPQSESSAAVEMKENSTHSADQSLGADDPASKPAPPPTEATPIKKKRGRPRKSEVVDISKPGPSGMQTATVQRKRGRPRKVPVEGVRPMGVASTSQDGGEPVKKKRGRPPGSASKAPAAAGTPGKRRGRPPKKQPDSSGSGSTQPSAAPSGSEGPSRPAAPAEGENFSLNISFSDASSDSEWSGAAKVSELTSRVATDRPSEARGGGGGGEGGKGDESSEESSYISDV